MSNIVDIVNDGKEATVYLCETADGGLMWVDREFKLRGTRAAIAWQRCMDDVEHLLDCDLIHGDLSGYNVLWWQGRPRLIDLPQAVDYRTLGNAFELLHRDITTLAKSFAAADLKIDPISVASGFAARYL